MTGVLLSFGMEGSHLGRCFADGLAQQGFEVIIDQRRRNPDDEYVEILKSNILRAAACVVILMPEDLDGDPWISFELGFAAGARKVVYLVSNEVERLKSNALLSRVEELVPASSLAILSRHLARKVA
jgi:nucleoside 2-deoxyribosyltransferase